MCECEILQSENFAFITEKYGLHWKISGIVLPLKEIRCNFITFYLISWNFAPLDQILPLESMKKAKYKETWKWSYGLAQIY